MRLPNYDRYPLVAVPGGNGACVRGWDAIGERIARAVQQQGRGKTVLVVECYTGVDESVIVRELRTRLKPELVVHASAAMLPAEQIDRLVEPFLGGEDPVFGCGG